MDYYCSQAIVMLPRSFPAKLTLPGLPGVQFWGRWRGRVDPSVCKRCKTMPILKESHLLHNRVQETKYPTACLVPCYQPFFSPDKLMVATFWM